MSWIKMNFLSENTQKQVKQKNKFSERKKKYLKQQNLILLSLFVQISPWNMKTEPISEINMSMIIVLFPA